MQRTLIGLLPQCIGQEVRIAGFVEKTRILKTMQFVTMQDHTGAVQLTHQRAAGGSQLESEIYMLTPGSAIEVIGIVQKNLQVKLGGIEVLPNALTIHSLATAPLPLDPQSGSELRLDWRFLDLRSPRNLLIFKVQTVAEQAMRAFWKQEGFTEMHSPKLMGSPSESGAELFRVEYFDREAYLAQSPQFYKQMAMAAGFDRVFEIGPVFRANPSFTIRHDTEFVSVDVEISWITSHEDVMQFEERWIQFVLRAVKEELGEEISATFNAEIVVPALPFPRVTMEEAYQILDGIGHRIERGEKGDLDPEGERLLYQQIRERTGHEFVFVTDYPAAVRAFYHMRQPDRPQVTKSFDLLWKGLEVTTGAQREHRYDILVEQAKRKGIDPESIRFYLDFFRYGCPPHGGFGFGLTRMLMVMLGLPNVREATYVYRGVKRLTP